MKEMEVDTDDQGFSSHSVESQQWIEKQQLPEGTRKVSKSKNYPILKYSLVHRFSLIFVFTFALSFKVLVVFNLKDRQSQFGDWISLFLKAAFMSEGIVILFYDLHRQWIYNDIDDNNTIMYQRLNNKHKNDLCVIEFHPQLDLNPGHQHAN